MALKIEDYALIGDGRTAALVGSNGSIDWLCLPRFDSSACFAAILGGPEHGHWQIGPADAARGVRRRYHGDTLVLETEIETADGACVLVDFMAVDNAAPTIVRLVKGLRGRVALRMELVIRFDYGRLVPWVRRGDDDALIAIAGPHLLVLRTPAQHHGEDFTTVADFTVSAGEELPFVLSYVASHLEIPPPVDVNAALRDTESYWSQWAGRCTYAGPWRDAVVRSLVTLKALTYRPTGGIIAAASTSLPERLEGARNWDYRFCWLRDATFTLLSLMANGYRDEAAAWRTWLLRATAGLPSQLQPLYGVAGEHRLDERELEWLPGYHGVPPVRIGNDACNQLQLDVFGEVLDALHHARLCDLAPSAESWAFQKALVEHLEHMTDERDRGIWEVRGKPQHFTYSKVMMWVAFDRAVTAVSQFGLPGPADKWRKLRDDLHAEICAKAFDPTLGSFVYAYGAKLVDASLLLIPLVGFLPPCDPRVVGTAETLRKHLMKDGFVHRYDTGALSDGLPPGEGAWLPCSFWLADNLALQGRHDEAREIFERLLATRNDVGLLAEEYDVDRRIQLGNFPQALSHLSLVNSACNLADEKGPARQRSKRHDD